MARNVKKEMHPRSRLRNRFFNDPTKKTTNYVRNRETSVLPLGETLMITNEKIWNFVRAFLVNKVSLNCSEIMIGKENKVTATSKK